MLKAIGIHRAFATQPLFDTVDWVLADRDHVGLVGPNGSGKSTWLKMLAGIESPDGGRFEAPKGQRIGYLPQFSFELGNGTVREEARSAFAPILDLRTELDDLERKMNDPASTQEESELLLDRYGQAEELFRHRGGYEIDRQVDQVLRGLGFGPERYDTPISELSGGWQMRVALAKLLLERPDVLLLDEPTNHLDIEAREWLEGFLRDYPGAFVVVSHDRYFLDVTVNRTTDIMARKMVDYPGNYSKYLELRERRFEMALKAYERQQDEIRRIERFIERFKAKNTKSTQAQSRIKMLEKMERLEKPVEPQKSVRFKFPQPERSGRLILTLEGIEKSYGENRVFEGVDLIVERGQKIALIGPNGAGKSTLMRILAGQESFQAGDRKLGTKVDFDFFAQDAADRLPGDKTILQAGMELAPTGFVPKLRGLLGAFLFSGPAVDKKISVLSGGERNRLALAFMLMTPSNLLLLDEPTNHLDMAAKDVLLDALAYFEGTVVFVSHDRYFLSELADRVIDVGNGGISDYPGDFEGFLAHRQEQADRVIATPVGVKGLEAGDTGVDGADTVTKRKINPRKVEQLEARISELEERKAKLEERLADGAIYRDAEKSAFYTAEYEELNGKLDEAMAAWAEYVED